MGEVAAAAVAVAFSPCRRRPPLSLRTACSSAVGGLLRVAGKGVSRRRCTRDLRPRRTTTRVAATHGEAKGGGDNKAPGFVSFSACLSTDIPFYEPPGASFDEYISDRPRVFRAMFPDERRSRRLNDDEWRIQMLPINFLFASVRPVVVMRLRCRSGGEHYPPGVPLHATSVLDLQATRWELQGLDGMYMPSDFKLGVQGALYSDRMGGGHHQRHGSRLKGRIEMSMGMVLPPVLALLPQDIVKGAAETVLKTLLEKMKQEVNVSLLSDFGNFRREKLWKRTHEEAPALPAAAAPPLATDDDPRSDHPSTS